MLSRTSAFDLGPRSRQKKILNVTKYEWLLQRHYHPRLRPKTSPPSRKTCLPHPIIHCKVYDDVFYMMMLLLLNNELTNNPSQDLHRNVTFLEKMVSEHNVEKIPRVLRNNSRIRQALTNEELKKAIELHLSDTVASKATLLKYVSSLPKKSEEAMDEDDDDSTEKQVDLNLKIVATDVIEVEVYFYLLVLTKLFSPESETLALQCSQEIVQRCLMFNRRTLDSFTAKAYFYFSFCHQKTGDLSIIRK